ncbi:proline---tRNA ligase [Synchytrium endobioticum]|uniref:proline--tRNA ligase n=1 Tax=Synchytrium endobioticum TaxID=286115 RepID=A0A507CUR6_9FUNG|nr:proline---tRNA ligase [Synchytrium endobioticum]TPX43874.1 proline---tRNA ligase [Synchytrium endobioticum]
MSINSTEALTQYLTAHQIPHKLYQHASTDSASAWSETIKSLASTPTKSLLVKPKGIKSGDLPILVLALDSTKLDLNGLIKSPHFGGKEGRIAADNLVADTLKVGKLDVTPFALGNVQDPSSIVVVVDQALAHVSAPLAFRAFASTSSLTVSLSDLQKYLSNTTVDNKIVDFGALGGCTSAPATNGVAAKAPSKAEKKAEPSSTTADADGDKSVLIGIDVKKTEDFSEWYQQVLKKSDMLDYYDISGCYILRPLAYKIWKEIQVFFSKCIEDSGVEDCYFPMFVSKHRLEREKDHIDGFAPEVAWVTKAGNSDLAEPVAVRPTSETVIYPHYADWVRSYRDLPLRLNQWCNVVRWEFKHPQPFLRTREFLWQEGHTAFATKAEADAEVLEILDYYRRVYEEVLAVPVIKGIKSEKEKFAGGLYTTTCEGFVPATGRGIQGATSHCLGQNFSKMFNISVLDDNQQSTHVWQNSWGLSTRAIGVCVMVHGDDQGLVLPPNVASTQVVVIPVGITAKTSGGQREALMKAVDETVAKLKAVGVRAKADTRDNYTPGWKYNHWELRGVPVRLEIGPKDLSKNEARAVRRDTRAATQLSLADIASGCKQLMDTIYTDMFNRAKQERDAHLIRMETFENFVKALDAKNIVLAPWCERMECEDDVKKESARIAQMNAAHQEQDEKAPSMGAKTLCIPFDQPKENPIVEGKTKCFYCDSKAKRYALWGRSY